MKLRKNSFIAHPLLTILILSVFLSCTNIQKGQQIISNNFYDVVSGIVINFDSVSNSDSTIPNRGSVYVLKVISPDPENKEMLVTIASIANGSIIDDLKPFYFTQVQDDIVLIKNLDNFGLNDIDGRFMKDVKFDKKIIDDHFWKIYGFSDKFGLVASPAIGFYKIDLKKRRNNILINYFITYPLASVPKVYRPITDYKTGPYFNIDSLGKSSAWDFKNYFKEYNEPKKMYDHKFKIKLRKDHKIMKE